MHELQEAGLLTDESRPGLCEDLLFALNPEELEVADSDGGQSTH